MKKSILYFLTLSLIASFGSHNVQSRETDPKLMSLEKDKPKSIYICDTLFSEYTKYFSKWWKKQQIKGSIPGKHDLASFRAPYSDLKTLDSLGLHGAIPDSIEAFFAFTSDNDYKKNNINIVFSETTDTSLFKVYTERWKKWSKKNIKGQQPVGVKIRFAELDSMFNLINNTADQLSYMDGYFAFHSKTDVQLNQIAIVFRPVFKGSQQRIGNDKITCPYSDKSYNNSKNESTSLINIDFTNPCPPCSTYE